MDLARLDLPDGAGFAFVVDNGLLRWDGQSDQVQSLFEGAPGEVQPSIEWAVLDRDRQIWMGRLDGGLLHQGERTRVELVGSHEGPRVVRPGARRPCHIGKVAEHRP